MMKHTCTNCDHEFEFEHHLLKNFGGVPDSLGDSWWIAMGTGKNVVVRGETWSEHPLCPECGFMDETGFMFDGRPG